MLTTEQIKKAENIRNTASGHIGGKELAIAATNEQILILCDLQDEHAALHNQLKENERLQNNIVNAITVFNEQKV